MSNAIVTSSMVQSMVDAQLQILTTPESQRDLIDQAHAMVAAQFGDIIGQKIMQYADNIRQLKASATDDVDNLYAIQYFESWIKKLSANAKKFASN